MRPTVIERALLSGPSGNEYLKKLVDIDPALTAAMVKNLLYTVKGAEQLSAAWNEEDFFVKETLLEYSTMLFQHIAEESGKETGVTYTTSDVAKFIGVSQQTINTWLRERKILGFEKETDGKWSRIPEDAEVLFANGKRVSIATLKVNWEKEHEEPAVDEVTYLERSIKDLEDKYGGTFEEVFGDKTIRELTEEDTDASVWLSYKVRLDSAQATQYS